MQLCLNREKKYYKNQISKLELEKDPGLYELPSASAWSKS